MPMHETQFRGKTRIVCQTEGKARFRHVSGTGLTRFRSIFGTVYARFRHVLGTVLAQLWHAVCTFYARLKARFWEIAKNNEFQGKVVGITGREETNGFRKLFSFREVRFVYVFSSPTSTNFAAEKT